MTTLTLQANLYDKSLEPLLDADPETVAVGETVKLRIAGLGLTPEEANVCQDDSDSDSSDSGDSDRPALRFRLVGPLGDVAMYPFPGDLPHWTEETLDDKNETKALCCTLDLATKQAYALFGGPYNPRGSVRVAAYVERPVESGNPTLYASGSLKIKGWPVRTPTDGARPPFPRPGVAPFPPIPISPFGGTL